MKRFISGPFLAFWLIIAIAIAVDKVFPPLDMSTINQSQGIDLAAMASKIPIVHQINDYATAQIYNGIDQIESLFGL